MAKSRIRPKVSFTIDARSLSALERLCKMGKAKNPGEAFDLIVNIVLMDHPDFLAPDSAYFNDRTKWLEQESERFLDETLNRLRPLLTEILTSHYETGRPSPGLSELKLDDVAPQLPPATHTWEQLLDIQLYGQSSDQIQEWAEGRKKDIEATGHTVDEFVTEKYARVIRPKPVEQPVERKVDISKVMQQVEEKMNDHWLNLNGQLRGMRSSDTTRFYVAHQVRNFNQALDNMDNGHKQETADALTKQLEQAATIRKWPKDQYMSEFQNIWNTYEKIMADQREQLRKETPGMKKAKQ